MDSFRSGTYTEKVTTQPMTLYRAYTEGAFPLGGFWSRDMPMGPLQTVMDSALNPAGEIKPPRSVRSKFLRVLRSSRASWARNPSRTAVSCREAATKSCSNQISGFPWTGFADGFGVSVCAYQGVLRRLPGTHRGGIVLRPAGSADPTTTTTPSNRSTLIPTETACVST